MVHLLSPIPPQCFRSCWQQWGPLAPSWGHGRVSTTVLMKLAEEHGSSLWLGFLPSSLGPGDHRGRPAEEVGAVLLHRLSPVLLGVWLHPGIPEGVHL